MTSALEYLTELYAEHGEQFTGTEQQAARILNPKAKPQVLPPRLKTGAEMMAEVQAAIAGAETTTVRVADCLPFVGNPFAQVVQDNSGKGGLIIYEQQAVTIATQASPLDDKQEDYMQRMRNKRK